MQTLVICSGGLDSVTLAYKVKAEGQLAMLLSFDYGQRHKKELSYAASIAKELSIPHHILDISSLGMLLENSALTDDVDVPEGHYAEDTMKQTIVPNRNAIMLTMAYGIAAAKKLECVAAAFHAGDHFIYPDCRPAFTQSFEAMQQTALEGVADITLYTPFVHQSKADIAKQAADLNIPIEKTWSCYKGDDIHCGRCGTCVERIEAFDLAGVEDPTKYADSEFWKQAVADAKEAA